MDAPTEKAASMAERRQRPWFTTDTFRHVQHPDLCADCVLANGSMSPNQSGKKET